MGTGLIIQAIFLGIALAMDAFSVSLANGIDANTDNKSKNVLMAVLFGVFQAGMPLIGWVAVHTIAERFVLFQNIIPWIAFGLLLFLGIKMIIEGLKNEEADKLNLTIPIILLQALATSIDALSVGFTISNHSLAEAMFTVAVIGAETFVISAAGIKIGKFFKDKLAGKATIVGGVILAAIGTEILIKSFF